jgi:nucleoid DNA-binding protein
MGVDDISGKVAKELNLSEHQVKEINRVQWKVLLDTMQEGEFKSVQMIYLGKFHKNSRYKNQKKDE